MKKVIYLAVILSLISLPSESAFLGLKKSAKNTTVRREESELSINSSAQTLSSNTSSANLSNEAESEQITLRDEPNGKILTYLKDVDEVIVINKQGNWYEVETSQGSGFIDKKWVEIDEYASGASKEGILEDDIEVFNDEGEVIGKLSENSKVEIIGSDDDDYKIKYNDSYGYISKDALAEEDDDDENNDNGDEEDDDDEVANNTTNDENEDVDDNDDTNSESLEDNDEDVFANEYHFIFSNPGDYKIVIGKVKYPKNTSSTTSTNEEKVQENITETKETSSEESVKDNTNKSKTKSDKTNKSKKSTKKKKNKNNKELDLRIDKKLNALLKSKDVKISKKLTRTIGKTWDEKGINYTHIQGFCTDGEYWYVALMSSTKKNDYTDQHTKLLKIRIKDKKVVASKHVGKIGHSNSLTYNPKTKKILSAPCSKAFGCIYEFNASNLGGKKAIYLKNKKGKEMKKKCYASFSYDEANDQYIVKLSNKCLGYFDSNFKLKKKVSVKHLKINDKMTGQAITCDGKNIFSVCNNLKVNPRINYILIYDISGKYVRTLTFKKELGTSGDRPEMEQLTCYRGNYWSLTNVHGKFRIHKIKLRE